MQDTEENADEWDKWIEEAIAKGYFKFYEYKHFKNIREIGSGGFGKVYRANWRDSETYLALKSFFNLNNITIKEIVHELKLQQDLQFHNNIIKFYGIAKFEQENQPFPLKNYMLVMEYADGGSLRNYLKKNFENLTWDDKYNLAYQLASAISCLHNEGIVHRDLHSNNILIHQMTIKLADFGLSKRIDEASKDRSILYGVAPYVDPERYNKKQNNDDNDENLNKKSDIYSIGVLLWEISSGRPPFNGENDYGFSLMLKISQGHREQPIPGTPKNYEKLYTECWHRSPDNRPSIDKVVKRLNAMMAKTDVITDHQMDNCNEQELNSSNSGSSTAANSSLQGELSKFIKNFDKMGTKEMESTMSKSLSEIVNEIVNFISKITNEGREPRLRKQYILNHIDEYYIDLQEIYCWLLNNKNNSCSIFLLGCFNSLGIGTDKNYDEAFNLFIESSDKDYILAQYYAGLCYLHGHGTKKNENLAFKFFKKSAKENWAAGQMSIGYCYFKGIGTKKDLKTAVSLYKKAANNGNIMATFNLGLSYLNGDGVNIDDKKAFELLEKSSKKEFSSGILMLGYCYNSGIGTDVDKEKAFELYKKAAYLGNDMSQYYLAKMYEKGEGVDKDLDEAIEWYEKSAEHGNQKAQNKVRKRSSSSCRQV